MTNMAIVQASAFCPGPDVAHVPTQKSYKKTKDRKYFLFRAAEDGCVPCVHSLITHEGIDPMAQSDSCKYSAEDFATWARDKAGDRDKAEKCQAVVDYLQQFRQTQPPAVSPRASTAEAPTSRQCNVCLSNLDDETGDINAKLRQAVIAQCISCTRHSIVQGADPLIESPGVWGESALTLANARCTRAWTIQQMLHPMHVPPAPPAESTNAPSS